MKLLVAMPRETNTSLFTSHVTQGLFLGFCIAGLVLITLIFLQNRRDWSERKRREYEDEDEKEKAVKSANRDFLNSTIVSFIVVIVFLYLIFDVSVQLLR
ncbi:hypothetical protein SAMN02745116_01796 [Pilibacter termitis]|uniref:Uncharacterized protein n=1 Tax=Pilibacter termitis TaxID=263852 RepID=A0A1T4PHR0_9ENTE|nr:hypothetical protein [Pilibacter termitis]SJZ90358.1 hypothetical protein SAMN02745116_01796 [Pilibacter termitis]